MKTAPAPDAKRLIVVSSVTCSNDFNGELAHFCLLTISQEAQARLAAFRGRLNAAADAENVIMNAARIDTPDGMSVTWTRTIPLEAFDPDVVLVEVDIQSYDRDEALPADVACDDDRTNHIYGLRGTEISVGMDGAITATAYCKYSGDTIETRRFTFNEVERLLLESNAAREALPLAA